MNIETKTIYSCEHCKRMFRSKYWANRHENTCRKNPAVWRPCFGCKHLVNIGRLRVTELQDYAKKPYNSHKENVLYCREHDLIEVSPVAEFLGKYKNVTEFFTHPHEDVKITAEQMPKKCSDYEVNYRNDEEGF